MKELTRPHKNDILKSRRVLELTYLSYVQILLFNRLIMTLKLSTKNGIAMRMQESISILFSKIWMEK